MTAVDNSCSRKGDQNPSDLHCCIRNGGGPSGAPATTSKSNIGIQNPVPTRKVRSSVPKIESSTTQVSLTSVEVISSTLNTQDCTSVAFSSSSVTDYSSSSTYSSPTAASTSTRESCTCLNSQGQPEPPCKPTSELRLIMYIIGYCGRRNIDCKNGCSERDSCSGDLVCCPYFGDSISC